MFHRNTLLGVILSGASVLACADSSTTGTWAGSVTDSAGITIVLNEGSVANVPTWTTEPEVVIGVIDDPDEYVFGEIGDVEVDSRGRLLVLDRQARLARVYGPDGRFLHDVGGPGEGPGELSGDALRIAAGWSDSIYILDFSQLRLNVYAADGSPARTIPLRLGRQGPYDFQLLGDSALLIRWFTTKVDPDGRFVPWDVLLRTDASAVEIDTVMKFDYPPPDLGGRQELHHPLITNTAFVDVLTDGRIAWSNLESRQVAIHDPTGKLELLVRTAVIRRRPRSARRSRTCTVRARMNRMPRFRSFSCFPIASRPSPLCARVRGEVFGCSVLPSRKRRPSFLSIQSTRYGWVAGRGRSTMGTGTSERPCGCHRGFVSRAF
jgi:6-bladed beta-propeller